MVPPVANFEWLGIFKTVFTSLDELKRRAKQYRAKVALDEKMAA
jgi:hypothetical protein